LLHLGLSLGLLLKSIVTLLGLLLGLSLGLLKSLLLLSLLLLSPFLLGLGLLLSRLLLLEGDCILGLRDVLLLRGRLCGMLPDFRALCPHNSSLAPQSRPPVYV